MIVKIKLGTNSAKRLNTFKFTVNLKVFGIFAELFQTDILRIKDVTVSGIKMNFSNAPHMTVLIIQIRLCNNIFVKKSIMQPMFP